MIEITFNPKNLEFEASGHAGADVKGKDIVCSAISILFYTLARNLDDSREMLKDLVIEEEDGNGHIQCVPKEEYEGNISCIYLVVLKGIEMVAETYPECVKFEIIEKK